MMLSLDTAYRSFGGEVEASSTPTICRLSDSRRHQLPAIAPSWRRKSLLDRSRSLSSARDRYRSPRQVVGPKINCDGSQAQNNSDPEDRRMMDRSSIA